MIDTTLQSQVIIDDFIVDLDFLMKFLAKISPSDGERGGGVQKVYLHRAWIFSKDQEAK